MKAAKWVILGAVIVALIFGGIYQNSRIERLEGRVRLMAEHETVTKAEVDSKIAAALYTEGARVYHDVDQSISNNQNISLAFNSERYDTDNIHDNVTNNKRLTCKTAGKYLVVFHCDFALNVTGVREAYLFYNLEARIAYVSTNANANGNTGLNIVTILDLNVDDNLMVFVYQNSGGALNVKSGQSGVDHRVYWTPVFMMQRIG